jgi:predicted  nucleic acid-binding Zn-ribbon protein
VARRDPSIQELEQRVTRLEQQVGEIATTVTSSNEAAVRETRSFRDAFIEQRIEVRQAFEAVAQRFDRLERLADQRHAEIMAQFEKLATKPPEN